MILDVIVLVALIVSAVIAFLRGFIREMLTILGVVGGLAASYFGGPLFAPIVRGWLIKDENAEPEKLFGLIPPDMAADALAYGSIFLIVVIVLSVASHLLAHWAKAIGLGAVDRTLGIIFGIARGAFILALLYLPFHVLADDKMQEEWFADSRTHFYVAATSEWMMTLVPESMKADMQKKAEDTAQSMAKSSRESLQELDVLGGDSLSSQSEDEGNKPDDQSGYKDEQRKDLNELFEGAYNE